MRAYLLFHWNALAQIYSSLEKGLSSGWDDFLSIHANFHFSLSMYLSDSLNKYLLSSCFG